MFGQTPELDGEVAKEKKGFCVLGQPFSLLHRKQFNIPHRVIKDMVGQRFYA